MTINAGGDNIESDEDWAERNKREREVQHTKALTGAIEAADFRALVTPVIDAQDTNLLAMHQSRAVILSVPEALDKMSVKELRELDQRLFKEQTRVQNYGNKVLDLRKVIKGHLGLAPDRPVEFGAEQRY